MDEPLDARLVSRPLQWQRHGMSTLTEIESAVASLPPSQQRTLLTWLQSLVTASARPAGSDNARREAWLQRLAERRQRGMTGRTGTPLQQIMDDLRGE
jgi:hypothetical protein